MEEQHEWTREAIAASCDEAADLLEGKWTRGVWYEEQDIIEIRDVGEPYTRSTQVRMCAEGALAAALGLDASQIQGNDTLRSELRDCAVYNAVHVTIAEKMNALDPEDQDGWADSIASWNDDYAVDEAEVLDVLRTTAKLMRGVGPDQMEVHHA